jgi:hypothetical protein
MPRSTHGFERLEIVEHKGTLLVQLCGDGVTPQQKDSLSNPDPARRAEFARRWQRTAVENHYDFILAVPGLLPV